MTDYPMLFESIVLAAWGKTWRREDPFRMGDADTLRIADNDKTNRYGHNAKFAVSAALKKIVVENEVTSINQMLRDLDNKLWAANTYDDICKVLDKTKIIFESIGMVVV